MSIKCKEQGGFDIYRKTFEFTDEDYRTFKKLPEEEDSAWLFWKDVGKRYGFDPKLIEILKGKAINGKDAFKGIEYIPNTKRRKFTALSKEK